MLDGWGQTGLNSEGGVTEPGGPHWGLRREWEAHRIGGPSVSWDWVIMGFGDYGIGGSWNGGLWDLGSSELGTTGIGVLTHQDQGEL